MSLKNKTCLVWDRGLYTYLAQKLGESFGKVYYYMPESSPYPNSKLSQIAEGLETIERIDDDEVWKVMDKSDMVFFPDCYDGEFQIWLQNKGYKVFGGLGSEKAEMDKVFFFDYLTSVGLPVPKTYRAEGLVDLLIHLQGKGEKWLKRSYYRGDFETKKYRDPQHLLPWIDMLRSKIGRRADNIEILVQDPIESEVEIGYDGFCVNGEYTTNSMMGYEIKDKAYLGKVFENTPEIIQKVNDEMSPLFKNLGYQGHYSTELRITKDGKAYFIDPTIRAPSPPSGIMCELYENYAEAVWEIANGKVPDLIPKAKFGAEIILVSDWHENNEMCVTFPKEIEPFIKLKNQTHKNGAYYVIPNENDGFFGSVVAYGDSIDEATGKCLEYMEQIECDDYDFDPSIFDKANEQIMTGARFGVEF
jgi:hypothetical protein